MPRRFPKWATPERRDWLFYQQALVLAHDPQGILELGGEPFHPAYDALEDLLREGWKEDDREERAALRRLEQERLHPRERIRQGGFDSIMREIFLDNQPTHYPEGPVGVDALSGTLGVKVRVASSPVRLWVPAPEPPTPELPPAPEGGWSKNALRKWRRYGKGPIATAIQQAVSDYHNSPA